MTNAAVKAVLNRYGLRPNKALGQNFLVDPAAVDKITAAVNPGSGDFILEIGPGLGALTMPLARSAARVTAVELDRTLAGVLELELKAAGLDVAVFRGDFLHMNIDEIAGQACNDSGEGPTFKIYGSLPYYITTPIMRKIFNCGARPTLAAVVIQKEVADKMSALPGTRTSCPLALEAAYHARIKTICELPPSCFYPQPEVQSRAVLLEMFDSPPVSSAKADLFKVINAAFSTRRKTLVNCLSQGLGISRETASSAVAKCGFPPDIRGERLSLFDYDILTKKIFDNIYDV
ncbi:MAG: 16S rRNA (adenine(1518)-N(6)/adenine(1519)-N(6))-dimethyltransferase RsmA [Defluviitaleaceae bacterium]|nr:16S rRNA (adenine(1518)-N(6)/adenine(1519)-N(6))-dimethyltransferase RsmA [Defluviitaleaceae bacterium]MCL2836999.1 16S rRNA (adenine(1518)-N(6)/adenine(1519)-N(6))-dimethyltransferase RsmA [Defluviitaleaceae bacterium]